MGEKGTPVEVSVLNLLAGATIRSIPLEDVRSLELEDPQLQEELSKALSALAQARDQDKKPVQINFTGQGERRVRIGYVVETPVWKTIYRLILSDDEKTKPAIQGWAIVENQTDNDWNNVQLSLVCGRPISFVQDLYQPLYVPRPVVQPELYASLRPQTYDEGLVEQQEAGKFADRAEARLKVPSGLPRRPSAAPPMRQNRAGPDARLRVNQCNPTASVASVASAAKIGELFQYTVGNVSLPRRNRRCSRSSPTRSKSKNSRSTTNPCCRRIRSTAQRLKNTTDKHLLAGPDHRA